MRLNILHKNDSWHGVVADDLLNVFFEGFFIHIVDYNYKFKNSVSALKPVLVIDKIVVYVNKNSSKKRI